MSIQYNGQNIKEMYYNGQKIKEAYYNGEKVFSSENVLYETDWTYTSSRFELILPETYPAGSIISWEPAISGYPNTYKIYGLANQQQASLSSDVTTITTSIAFNYLVWSDAFGTYPGSVVFHIKIIGAN